MPRYELIIPSASRPHLLRPTLESLAKHVDEQPVRIWAHDDAVFPGRQGEVADVLSAVGTRWGVPVNWKFDDPPIRHGPALAWLLDQVESEYVLYSQDDFVAVRPLPIRAALALMTGHQRVNQVRFNKRATREYKDTWRGRWYKQEVILDGQALTVSDHWYFQTGLWRVSTICSIVRALRSTPEFRRSCEEAVNVHFDQELVHRKLDPLDPATRARELGTYIWGKIGDDKFIHHIGGDSADWAGDHPREELKPGAEPIGVVIDPEAVVQVETVDDDEELRR